MTNKKEKTIEQIINEPMWNPLDSITFRGSTGFLRRVVNPIEKKAVYMKNKINLGIDEYKQPTYLNVREPPRILVVAPTGFGKTFLCQSILSRMAQVGDAIVILNDVKNEYKSMKKPVQVKWQNKLAKNEQPMGMPIKIYRPQFLIKYEGHNKYDNIPIQISFQDLEFDDLTTLLSMSSQERIRNALMRIFSKIKKHATSFHDVEKIIEESPDNIINQREKKELFKRFINLKEYEVIGNKYRYDFVDDINNGVIPIINTTGFKKMGDTYSGFPQGYIAIILRQLVEAKKDRHIKKGKLWVFIDEVTQFCPNKYWTVSKREIINAIKLSRGYGVNFLMCSQDENVPEELLTQSKYIMMPKMNISVRRNIIKRSLGMEESPSFRNQELEFFSRLRKFMWVVLDKEAPITYNQLDALKIFKPYAPLCAHQEARGKY